MKIRLLIFSLTFSLGLQAQNFAGQAFYQSKTTVDMDNFGREGMSEDMKKQIMARMKSFLEKTYILTFNGSESLYKEEASLDVETQGRGWGMMMASATPGIQYKNLEDSAFVQAQDFFGKSFLIKDAIPALEWEITDETKMIGAYLAIKARAVKEVKANDFSMMRRRDRRAQDADKDKEKQKSDSLKTDPIDELEMPKTIEVTAWFTPQIPLGHGPGEYAGLPGLILELNADRTTLLCSKIVMNPKDLPSIEAPSKGTVVTQDEFEAIVKEKTQEMRDNWRNRSGRRGRGE
ncbi:MAG: GLPGLI family protein [Flavobacteriaceae bacterium]|nr:GLPGLI family protein [Flavobacteriaceae bacterium]